MNPLKELKSQLDEILKSALGRAVANNQLPLVPINAYTIEVPQDKNNGDLATNIAMISAKSFKKSPMQIANIIGDNIILDHYFVSFKIATPGFINFFVSQAYYNDIITTVDKMNDDYGRSDYYKNKSIMVEFVSANPTGPMHIGNARGGAIGDTLSSILDFAGYNVTREFYVNDAGNQIEKFALSLATRYLQLLKGEDAYPFCEDYYQGEDIKVLAKKFEAINGDKYVDDFELLKKTIVDYALPINVQNLKDDLLRYRIEYDVWFSESTLYQRGLVSQIVDKLIANDKAYEKDGAIFYKAADKDEVLVRANGIPTYFAADIAYHFDKLNIRKFDTVIDVWGADHHGHVARLKGALDDIGEDGSRLNVVLMQLVRLVKDGETVRVSKRTGKSITLTDLLDDIPIDAARFFFNMREPNSHLDFDLDLAIEQTSKNPVYYVQYAYARGCSILRNLDVELNIDNINLSILNLPEEIELIRQLGLLPSEIIEAAKAYEPSRITRYATELASLFHKWYNVARVKGEKDELQKARLMLCRVFVQTMKNVLELLKIEAREVM